MSDLERADKHIARNYDIRKRIGKGAYGIVWKAVDRHTGEIVAVKKIFDAFSNATDAQRTYREVAFLQAFSDHENVVQLLNVIKAENNNDIYLVFEYMDTDLHSATKSGILKPIHKQYIMYQLLKVTKYLHSGNVIHRDLKPSNVLLNAECFVKLCDFGLARSLTAHEEEVAEDPNKAMMTDYVATRWYRAPEILLGSPHYTHGVDMWSLGCILGEVLGGRALFAGSSTLNQIERIIHFLPPPTRSDLDSLKSPYAQSLLRQVPRRPRRSFAETCPHAPMESIDLMNKLLLLNPEKRISASSALEHAYVAQFHDPSEEPTLDQDVVPKLDDNIRWTVDKYRTRLYESIHLKRAELKQLEEERLSQVSLDPPPQPVAKQTGAYSQDVTQEIQGGKVEGHHTGLLSCSSESSLHTLHKKKEAEGGGAATQSTPDLGSLARRNGSAVGKPPLQPKKVRPVSSSSPKAFSKSTPIDANQLTYIPATQGKKLRPLSGTQHLPASCPQTRPPVAMATKHERKPSSTGIVGSDLCVTSARMMPQARPTAVKQNRKTIQGTPSQFASYTQSYGTISQSQLRALKQCRW